MLLSGIIYSFGIEWARADDTIYIKADGSIVPTGSSISTIDNSTYTLTGNITADFDGIVVEKNNTILDGNGYTIVSGGVSHTTYGIFMENVSDVVIRNVNIRGFRFDFHVGFSSNITLSNSTLSCNNKDCNTIVGAEFDFAFNCTIANNNFTGKYGLSLVSSSCNTFSGNSITDCQLGIYVPYFSIPYSSNNTFCQNSFTRNLFNIYFEYFSPNNRFFHNNFSLGSASNGRQVEGDCSIQIWDNGVEGNYWSDYNGTDSNQDGIGDTPYVINENCPDHYPLMGTFQSFNVSAWNISADLFEEVTVISNSTIEKAELFWDMSFEYPWRLDFIAHGQNGTIGFCRVTFPNDMLNSSTYPVHIMEGYIIKIPTQSRIVESNGTHTTIYFTYNQTLSDYNIDILPEFPSFLVIPLFMIATLLAIAIYKRRHLTRA